MMKGKKNKSVFQLVVSSESLVDSFNNVAC